MGKRVIPTVIKSKISKIYKMPSLRRSFAAYGVVGKVSRKAFDA